MTKEGSEEQSKFVNNFYFLFWKVQGGHESRQQIPSSELRYFFLSHEEGSESQDEDPAFRLSTTHLQELPAWSLLKSLILMAMYGDSLDYHDQISCVEAYRSF
jgi:hypothetical protein